MSSTLSCDGRKTCLLPESGFSPVMKNDPYLCLHRYISGAHKGLIVPLTSFKKTPQRGCQLSPEFKTNWMRFCGNCFKCVTRAVSWGTRHDCFGESKDAALRRTFKVGFCDFGLLLTVACWTVAGGRRLPVFHQEPASKSLSGCRCPLLPPSHSEGPALPLGPQLLPFLSDDLFADLKDMQETKDRGETEREEMCPWDRRTGTGNQNRVQRDTLCLTSWVCVGSGGGSYSARSPALRLPLSVPFRSFSLPWPRHSGE